MTRNRAVARDESETRRVGIFDTLGYLTYENGDEFAAILASIEDFEGLPFPNKIDSSAPVWVLQFPFKTEVQGRVVIPLAPAVMVDSKIHNLRAAFAAGLSHGSGKKTVLLQEGDDPVPLDYRDLVQSFRHPGQIDDYIADLASDVTDQLQSAGPVIAEPGNLLFRLDLGSSTAEIRIVVGRKGAGKTAVFSQVRDHVRDNRQNIVLDLKPEGYQLRKFKDQILDFQEAGTAEHTITAFWEYLLLLEIVYKVLEKDKLVHMRDHRLSEPYQRLSIAYSEEEYVREGDFSERMLRLVDGILETFRAKYAGQTDLRLSQRQVTEILYLHNLRELRSALEEYLQYKGEVWILFDNLDKGWSTHGVSDTDLLIIRCLLDASRKLEQSFGAHGIDCHTIIFLRNDIYQLLVSSTPDRGKEIRSSLDWSEPDLLRQIIKRRLLYNDLPQNLPFEQLWRLVCVAFVEGEESSQYLIDRSLMRPRFLLNLISHCRGFAVNLEHEKIEEADIKRGFEAYSTDLLYDIDLEIRDVLPIAEDVLYNMIGLTANLSLNELNELLSEGGFDKGEISKLIEIFLWYGVLGVVREDGETAYIYNVSYDVRRLQVLIGRLTPEAPRLMINPAFWAGLEIQAAR